MHNIIDISIPLHPDMPIWPGSSEFRLSKTIHKENGDRVIVSRLECDVHVGTHLDAPMHFLEDGITIDQISLEILIGPAIVIYLPEIDTITSDILSNLNLESGVKRLLLRTRNSEWWKQGVTEFRKDFVALNADAAQWIVDYDIQLIGIDYLSVQKYGDCSLTHKKLLSAGIVILEGLNLSEVEPGQYELICLPLNLLKAEGAPARAVLRT